MRAIVDWLITIEHDAHTFYHRSAELIQDDPELKTFLQQISADEAEHYHLMASAHQFLGTLPFRKPQIEVDDSIKTRIESTFRSAQLQLDKGFLDREALIDCIVESEFSEWNDLFLYVLNTLKTEDRIFEHSALHVQRHMRHIEHYLKSSEYGRNKLHLFTELPYAKKGKILIVDDETAISELMHAMLEEICDSDLAGNGEEAIEKIRSTPYDLVISDMDMPIMDGLELYKKAAHLFNRPNDSFIFHTGNLTDGLREYFETNSIMYLEKPSSIMEIRDVVSAKLHLE